MIKQTLNHPFPNSTFNAIPHTHTHTLSHRGLKWSTFSWGNWIFFFVIACAYCPTARRLGFKAVAWLSGRFCKIRSILLWAAKTKKKDEKLCCSFINSECNIYRKFVQFSVQWVLSVLSLSVYRMHATPTEAAIHAYKCASYAGNLLFNEAEVESGHRCLWISKSVRVYVCVTKGVHVEKQLSNECKF